LSLRKAITDAEAEFDAAGVVNALNAEDPERVRIKERGHSDQHRRKPDQRVERRDQLRHVSHLDPPRRDKPDGRADGDGGRNLYDRRDAVSKQSRDDGYAHADHAETVAALARHRARQATQGEDEAGPGDQIGDRDD
jgi:hypothetical protein